MKKKNRNRLLLFFVVAACLNGVFVGSMSASVFATSSLTVTVADTISLDIMPKSASGTFAHSSTSTDTVTVITDNYTGYTLGIAASTANDNALSYKVNDTIVDSIASHTEVAGVSASDYADDNNASTLNNTWGYRPSTYYDTTNNTNVDNTTSDLYFPAPTSTSITTLAKTTTANSSEADNYNIAIGARVGIDKTLGAYTNTLVITVVANATPYSLTYDANAGGDSTVANMPSGVVSGTSYADTITLSSTVPTRTGYTFAGWCATNTSQTSCSGTLYNSTNNNLDSFPIDRTASSNSLNAYAIWTVKKTYIQDLTLANCPTDGMTVYDKRDEKDYTVKLINGQCWMTQNLRYLGDTGSAAKTMTIGNNNSNVANKSITLYSLNSSNAGSFNAYSSHCDDTNGYNYACVYVSGKTSTGVWYNYYAASAGTISGSSNSTAAISDICPAGWHLPSGPNTTANTNYNKLVGNTTAGLQNPTAGLTAFSAVAGGYYYYGSLYGTGSGFWWSATAYDTTDRYYMNYNSSKGQFRGDLNFIRYYGYFVRCVKDSDGYMQDFALANAEDDVEYTLVDKRDNNTYTVKKINGQLWMTQNLRYLGDTGSAAELMTIGNNNSNVANKSITLYSLDSSNAGSFNAYSSHCDNTNGYNYACVYDSGSTSTGVWYNYYAASAGTISTDSNSTAATSDICPAGWHLPSGPNTTANTDFNKLVGNTTSGWQNPTAGFTAFSAVAGGFYTNGSLYSTGYGYWWSATAYNTAYRYNLGYNSSDGLSRGNNYISRFGGSFVRCVRSS